MSFISHTACNGDAPRAYAGRTNHPRNTLLATMMRDREAVRYLVAPAGFGKSLLACSYADLMFDFRHTYWFDCENPCFLRDLDAGSLLSDILDAAGVGALVVFDDVPRVGATRKKAFWRTCSKLVAQGREVVVCATPASHPLAGHDQECVCLMPKDFLFSTAEADNIRSIEADILQQGRSDHPASRVPALVLRRSGAFRDILVHHIEDVDDPAQAALSMCLLLLETGSFEDVGEVLGRDVSAAEIDAAFVRPFVAADEFAGEFDASGFPFAEVLQAFTPYMTAIAQDMGAGGPSDLACSLATALLQKGRAERASKLLMTLCEPSVRGRWLVENQQAMLDACALVAAETLYESLRSNKWRSIPNLHVASCVRRAMLGLAASTHEDLAAVASKVEYALDVRLEAAAYAYLLAEDQQIAHEVETLFAADQAAFAREVAKLDEGHARLWDFWRAAPEGAPAKADKGAVSSAGPAVRSAARPKGKAAPPAVAMEHDDKTQAARVQAMVQDRCCLLALACSIHKARMLDGGTAVPVGVCQQVRAVLCDCSDTDSSAALALLRREVDASGMDVPLQNARTLALYRACDAFEDGLQVQRGIYARAKAARASAAATAARVQLARANAREAQHLDQELPALRVRLFGQFCVELGGVEISNKAFKRQKVRTLLALLVLESGHDLSCENLAERMWPDSAAGRARHNLYNCTSILRKELALADGSCPYLNRSHGVLSVNAALVESDVDALTRLCRHLRFDDLDTTACLQVLEQIRDTYRGDLLPVEREESMIVAARDEWRNRLVNTLLYTAKRLVGMGDCPAALQFAQRALAYDPQREDCYEILMAIQARSGQRPAAIDTWLRYRQFVNDELGLDPAPRMSDLFERIIADENV